MIMLGVSFVPLIVAVGMAVDYGNSRWIESQIHAAGDLGVLAAAATRAAGGGDDADTVTYGKQVFSENMPKVGGGAAATPTISWNNDIVTLVATAQVPSPFLSVVSKKTIPVRTVSKAAYGPPTKACILAMNRTVKQAIKIYGGALEAKKCAVWSNSGADASLYQGGSSSATATGFCAHGNVTGDFSPKPRSKCKRVEDPLENLTLADADSWTCDVNQKTQIKKQDGLVKLSPGVYCNDIDIQTEAQVELLPGTFHIYGQLVVRSDATVIGAATADGGNTIIFYGPDAGYYFNGAGKITLNAPPEGEEYAGLAIATDGENVGYDHTINGGAGVDIKGTVYLPGADFKITGSIEVNINASTFTIIADTVELGGGSDLNVESDNDVANLPTDTLVIAGEVLLIE
ncbi:MAG: hypothetical protein ACR2OR_05325 [Hyphomicrobiales bacterium]